MDIHRGLINESAELRGTLEQLMDMPQDQAMAAVARSNILPFSRRLIDFVHHHHEIEDHGYFPQFVRLYPNLEQAMALLDGDHKVLNQSLDRMDRALRALHGKGPGRDGIAAVYEGSQALENILKRHIWDEEEVIIPIFLKHA